MAKWFSHTYTCWPSDANSWLTGKVPDSGKDWGQKEKSSENETAGQHHWCNGHELGQTSGDGEDREACRAAAHGVAESDTTGQHSNIFFQILFTFWLITEYWAEFPVLYSRSLLIVYFKYSSMEMSVPNSQSIPIPPFLVTIHLFSKSVSLFLFSR